MPGQRFQIPGHGFQVAVHASLGADYRARGKGGHDVGEIEFKKESGYEMLYGVGKGAHA